MCKLNIRIKYAVGGCDKLNVGAVNYRDGKVVNRMSSKRLQIPKQAAINRRVPASIESQLKTSLQSPYLLRVNLCNCAIFRAVIFTPFSNKTSIIIRHQVRDLRANLQALQTSSFEIEGYLKEYLLFLSILSAAEWRESKRTLSPTQSLEQRVPNTFFWMRNFRYLKAGIRDSKA